MNTPKKGERYTHFKGEIYEIICLGKHSETQEEMVVYKNVSDSQKNWIIPLAMFVDTATFEDGTVVQRFTKK